MEIKPTVRTCKYCRSQYEVKPGLKNLKNLFNKPTWDEWFIFIMIIGILIGAYFYYHDVKDCHETLNNLDQVCMRYSEAMKAKINQEINNNPLNNISVSIKNTTDKINSLKLFPNENRTRQ